MFCICIPQVACSYSEPENRIQIKDVSVQKNTNYFVVSVLHTIFQKPTGFFNTFPDGGVEKQLKQSVILYLCNVTQKKAQLLFELAAPLNVMTSFNVNLMGWHNKRLLFMLSGCPSGSKECWGSLVNYNYYITDMLGNYSVYDQDTSFFQSGTSSILRQKGETIYTRAHSLGNVIKVKTDETGDFEDMFVLVGTEIQPVSNANKSFLYMKVNLRVSNLNFTLNSSGK